LGVYAYNFTNSDMILTHSRFTSN